MAPLGPPPRWQSLRQRRLATKLLDASRWSPMIRDTLKVKVSLQNSSCSSHSLFSQILYLSPKDLWVNERTVSERLDLSCHCCALSWHKLGCEMSRLGTLSLEERSSMLFPGTRMGMYLMDLDMFHGSSCCIVRYCKWVHRVPVITCHNHILRRNTLVITLVWRMTRRRRFGHWIFGLDIGPSLEKKTLATFAATALLGFLNQLLQPIFSLDLTVGLMSNDQVLRKVSCTMLIWCLHQKHKPVEPPWPVWWFSRRQWAWEKGESLHPLLVR